MFDCAGERAVLAEQLCAQDRPDIDPASSSDAAWALLAALFNQGSLMIDEDD
jgi:hypothetical protein